MTPYTWAYTDPRGTIDHVDGRSGAPLLALVTPDTTCSDVHLVGELDTSTCVLLSELVEEQLRTRHLEVRLHLTELTFCDLDGLRTLLRCQQQLRAAGGRLVLLRPRPLLVRIAGLAGWAEELGLVPAGRGTLCSAVG